MKTFENNQGESKEGLPSYQETVLPSNAYPIQNQPNSYGIPQPNRMAMMNNVMMGPVVLSTLLPAGHVIAISQYVPMTGLIFTRIPPPWYSNTQQFDYCITQCNILLSEIKRRSMFAILSYVLVSAAVFVSYMAFAITLHGSSTFIFVPIFLPVAMVVLLRVFLARAAQRSIDATQTLLAPYGWVLIGFNTLLSGRYTFLNGPRVVASGNVPFAIVGQSLQPLQPLSQYQ